MLLSLIRKIESGPFQNISLLLSSSSKNKIQLAEDVSTIKDLILKLFLSSRIEKPIRVFSLLIDQLNTL